MTILLTGSLGKTTLPLSHLLSQSPHSFLLTSRSPSPCSSHNTVLFNWTLPSTHLNPFTHPIALKEGVSAVWIVGTDIPDISKFVVEFIRVARSRGVRRFVMLSAWEVGGGDGVMMGRAHGELERSGREEEGVEWVVLRANYFMDNFLTYYLPSLKPQKNSDCDPDGASNGTLYTASSSSSTTNSEGLTGKKAFIDARDIAAVAYHALVDEKFHRNREYFLTGPESLTDGQVAALLSRIMNREISCEMLGKEDFRKWLVQEGGLSEWMAEYLAELEIKVEKEGAGVVMDTVLKITGREPRRLEDFLRENREKFS